MFDFALHANAKLRLICSLTWPLDKSSQIGEMMAAFPGRVSLLVDGSGVAVKFGDGNFEAELRKTLEVNSSATL